MYVHCANLSREFSRVDKVRTCVMFKLREQDVSAAVIVDNVCSRLLDLCCSKSGPWRGCREVFQSTFSKGFGLGAASPDLLAWQKAQGAPWVTWVMLGPSSFLLKRLSKLSTEELLLERTKFWSCDKLLSATAFCCLFSNALRRAIECCLSKLSLEFGATLLRLG